MCGGFVAIYSHNSSGTIMPHILYNLGRLTTYMFLGASAALLGQKFDIISGATHISSLLVAVSLVSVGIFQLVKGRAGFFEGVHKRAATLVSSFAKPILQGRGALKPYAIGLVTTLLPCGWLYVFVALCLGSADVSAALLIMVCFWLGTLPAMAALGAATRFLSGRLAASFPRLTALILIFTGLLSFMMHLAHQHHSHEHPNHAHIHHTH
ncbi:MAG: sulfite exporter TauE/SafE family protein [Deltaproteobacteria bacterium]|nr:sulfite exporter TauE/SafE family protein [Deltaproteobacteria bacterium]